jgi:hypothetical protein
MAPDRSDIFSFVFGLCHFRDVDFRDRLSNLMCMYFSFRRQQNVHNAPKPVATTPSPFYTIVQNRQNGKWEMVSTKPNSMTNGSGNAFVGITTSSIATTSPSLTAATPVVGNFPALIQLSANDPTQQMSATTSSVAVGKKNTSNKTN